MALALTHQRLTNVLEYNQETGLFVWKIGGGGRKAGDAAGCFARGYLVIRVDGRLYRAHRLAWFYVTGFWPHGEIDHLDGTKNNNKWDNLRDTTRKMNMQNLRKPRNTNKSGFLGVSPCCGKWKAQIVANGKLTIIGLFDSPQAAHGEYLKVKRELHVGCTI